MNELRKVIFDFFKSKENYSIIAGVASGLYPLLYYYNSNFPLVNSWSQFLSFILSFIVVPSVLFLLLHNILKKINGINKFEKYLIPVLNISFFSVLLVISTYGLEIKILLLVLFIAFFLGVLLYRHIKKIIVFQFILALMVIPMLIPDVYKHLTYSREWMKQPDNIENAVFKKRPNIYVIQPDGYANFSELKKGYYNFNNDDFESFLVKNEFKLYEDYRSNYFSTLSSNSSMFAMKHHYFNKTKTDLHELYNSRDVIVGVNPVISILKNNDYKTSLLLEKAYLLVNRPKVFYDFCNIELSEISFLARGFEVNKDIKEDLNKAIVSNSETSNFYFIEKMLPGHISTHKQSTKGKKIERNNYIEELKKSNKWLQEVVELILNKDKNSLVVIVADHGGFVGMDYTLESKIKQTDRDLVSSIFTSALAIRWPDGPPQFDSELKTSVNLFRVLFSYLSDNEIYLKNLEEDKSFAIITEGASQGVYEYIDESGNIVFSELKN